MVDRIVTAALRPADRAVLGEGEALAAGTEPPKFDINLAGHPLLRRAGLAQPAADELRSRRPFWHIDELDGLGGLTPALRSRIKRLFTVAPLVYPDKSTGREVRVAPDPSEVVLAEDESERGPRALPGAAAGAYRRLRSGGLPALTTEAEAVPADRRFPAFRDGDGQRRYLDPRYVAIQAEGGPEQDEVAGLLQSLGLVVEHRFATPGLFLARLTLARHGLAGLATVLTALSASSAIALAEPAWLGFDDLEGEREAAETERATALPWNLALIGVERLWQRSRGDAAVTIACVDTGVDATHPAIARAIAPAAPGERRDFIGDGGAVVEDTGDHGTGVCGFLVGDGSGGVFGLAPGCRLLPLRVPLSAGLDSYARRRDALLSLLPRAQAGRRIVVNVSWRTTGDVALVRTAIEALHSAGALVVCSAGNGAAPPGTPHFPSDYPAVVSVAAVDAAGAPAAYTDRGPAVDLAAPGGTQARPLLGAAPGGGTMPRWGTSFAAPHVAGAAALAWSVRPDLPAAQLRATLEDAGYGRDPDLGHGLLDLAKLEALLGGVGPPEEPPEPGAEPKPEPAPAGRWPVAGPVLAELGAACGMKAITQRILRARAQVARRAEAAAVLGMTPAVLDCIEARLECEGSAAA